MTQKASNLRIQLQPSQNPTLSPSWLGIYFQSLFPPSGPTAFLLVSWVFCVRGIFACKSSCFQRRNWKFCPRCWCYWLFASCTLFELRQQQKRPWLIDGTLGSSVEAGGNVDIQIYTHCSFSDLKGFYQTFYLIKQKILSTAAWSCWR